MKKQMTMFLYGTAALLLLASCGGNPSGMGGAEPAAEKEDVKSDREDAPGADHAGDDRSPENSSAAKGDGDSASVAGGEDAGASEDWKQAYLNWLSGSEYADACTYSLIYVDEDEIPELVADTGVEAGGCQIVTWHDGKTDVLQTDRLYFNYLEKGNLLCNSEGHMGYYYDNIYTIKDGVWELLYSGTYHDPESGPQLDENEIDYIYEYEWQGQPVEQSEYERQLAAVYPAQQAAEPEKYYIMDEMSSILKTGETTSVNHRYELIVDDLTWSEACAACEEKGGYLATLTSWEEFERVQAQMISEEKTSVTFFVGAANREDTFGYAWLEPGVDGGYNILANYNALFEGYWLEGEPSYTGIAEDGREVKEDCMAIIYRSSEGRCYLNDVADDILSEAPSFAGRVGYICEYDE